MSEVKTMKERKLEISLMSVIACAMVVFIHCSSEPVTLLERPSAAYAFVFVPWRFSGMAVYAFVFLAGLRYFISGESERSAGKYYLSRLKRVILPYVFWAVLYYVYFSAHGYYSFDFPDMLRGILVGDISAQFYFVVMITQFYLLAPVIGKLVRRTSPAIVLPVSLAVMLALREGFPDIVSLIFHGAGFPYTDRMFFSYLFFYLAGCYAGLYYEKFKAALMRAKAAVLIMALVCAAADGALSVLHFTGVRTFSWLEHVHVLYCMVGMAALLIVCLTVTEKVKSPRLGEFVKISDAASFYVFLSHILPIYTINYMMLVWGTEGLLKRCALRLVFTYFVSFALSVSYVNIKRAVMRMLSGHEKSRIADRK